MNLPKTNEDNYSKNDNIQKSSSNLTIHLNEGSNDEKTFCLERWPPLGNLIFCYLFSLFLSFSVKFSKKFCIQSLFLIMKLCKEN